MRRRPMVVAPGRMGRPGLMGTMARTAVVAGTATAVSGGVSRRAAQRADEQAEYQAAQYQAQQSQAAQQQAAAMPSDTMAKIRELADMRSQGLLTDEEFAAAKAQILGT
jgi:membrane protease subunit (stomatin/prohibitin family)